MFFLFLLVDYMATYKHSRTILVYPIMQNTQHAIVTDRQQVLFFVFFLHHLNLVCSDFF